MEPIPFSSANATAFRWLRTQEDPLEFDLLAEDTLLATLRWKHAHGGLTIGRTAAGSWTIKRNGFLNPHITARPEAGGRDLARISVHLSYHQIEIPGGPSYRFHRAGLLLPAWQVTTNTGQEVLHIEPVRDGRRLIGGAVVANPSALARPELPLLAVLTWFFIVLAWFEDETLVPLENVEARAAGAG